MADTIFADVSEFQAPVDDSYPYPVLSIRVSDGTYVDHNFAHNYAWMRSALDSGKLTFGIVYTYVRPATWDTNRDTVINTINANGGLHPRVVLMLDVESGGNGSGDQSDGINRLYWALHDWGAAGRIIGYGNTWDLNSCWPTKPDGIPLIVAAYGSNPSYPNKIAHQYTDGSVGADPANGLPSGAPPFGNCDMNAADGLDANAFAAACGIGAPVTPPVTPPSNPPTGGNIMADANTIANANDGIDPNGKQLPWRLVHMLRDAQIGDLSTVANGDAEGPNVSSSIYDQVTTLTKILSRRYKGHDVFDMLALIGDHLGVL
jgi:hypothetical protein